MNGRVGYVIQCLESFNFLYMDEDGAVNYTPFLKLAGTTPTYESAFELAADFLHDSFAICTVWVPEKK
ncbi:hypothetical protein [Undibacterium oligocarboniphilum]|uniref:Uncharacterized protein n=1 Tax=Undibacterium oligocarboniphilum TaxID=666702 RepID=A0A850QU16_9BURK|nr:hypothetical protein [Undibacterium oligocarboniphilum]MBC3871920.1 hypothetical protein [Undibacterium oligocarboniphilum]NVO79496.1 hypothetical protein [Undibacterium oligocarboniphilum]